MSRSSLFTLDPTWQRQYGIAIAPGKTFFGRIPMGQPLEPQMLARRDGDRNFFRYTQAENILRVVRRSRRIAVAPDGIDFEYIAYLPVGQRVAGGIQAGFLSDLADRGFAQRFAFVLAASDRLPVPGMIGTLEQQHVELRRIDDYQRRDGDLVAHDGLVCNESGH